MRIDNSSTQSWTARDDGPSADAQAQSGVWQGRPISVAASDEDILSDAAEEISFARAEHVEARKLEDRKIEESPEFDLPPIEAILAYLNATGDAYAEERLKQFVDALKRNAQRSDINQHRTNSPRNEARRRFDGPTEQYLALSYAVTALSSSGSDHALLDQVRDALQDLHEEEGRGIHANLNTVDVAAQFGEGDPARFKDFQATYRDAVLDGETLNGMLEHVLNRFGARDYQRTIQHMIRALGSDLSAIQGPSVERTRLHAVLQDMYQMEVLSTLLEGCQRLVDRMSTRHALAGAGGGELLRDLVSASADRWSNAARFMAIADKHDIKDIAPRITFLSGLKILAADIPVKVFPDVDARSNVLDAVQEAVDIAVDQEDQ